MQLALAIGAVCAIWTGAMALVVGLVQALLYEGVVMPWLWLVGGVALIVFLLWLLWSLWKDG